VNFQVIGTYELCITSDDGSKLFLDDELIVDNDGLHDDITKYTSKSLVGVHKVDVEFLERTGGSTMILEWKRPTATLRSVIPKDAWSDGCAHITFTYVDYFGCLPSTDRNDITMIYLRNSAAGSWEYHEGIANSCKGHFASIVDSNEEAQQRLPQQTHQQLQKFL